MNDSDLAAALVTAHGRVQGVFYRDTMRRGALSLGVHGYALNLGDGTVECHFEGKRKDVEMMIDIAREGSPRAEVEQLDVEWIEPAGADGFRTA